jgi:hypothetical protein
MTAKVAAVTVFVTVTVMAEAVTVTIHLAVPVAVVVNAAAIVATVDMAAAVPVSFVPHNDCLRGLAIYAAYHTHVRHIQIAERLRRKRGRQS